MDIHYNLLNECNSVILALISHNRRPPQFFLFRFLGFFPLCRNQIPCVEKKWLMPSRGDFLETSPGIFETHAEIPPLVTDGVEVTSLLIGLFLPLPVVSAFSISVWTVRKRYNV